MRSGSLNRWVIIQKQEVVRDPVGGVIVKWVDFATVPANIKGLSGSESIKADAEVSVVKVSIRIRYRTDIDASMRIKRGDTVYEIRAVLSDEARQEHIDLVCEAINQ